MNTPVRTALRSASARDLFICGALTLPALLFQQDLGLRAIQVVLILVLCAIAGRRIRLSLYLIVSAGVIASNLILASGRVLFLIGGFRVTEGGLRSGVAKAAALAGMMALSKLCVRPDLRLPGKLGWVFARCLMYFELIMSNRARIKPRKLIESLDAVLGEAWSARVNAPPASRADSRSTPAGYALMCAFVLLNWAALAVSASVPVLIWRR